MNPYAKAENQFSQNAENYRDSPIFAAGEELEWMKTTANAKGHEHLLDIGCAAGHTVFPFQTLSLKGSALMSRKNDRDCSSTSGRTPPESHYF